MAENRGLPPVTQGEKRINFIIAAAAIVVAVILAVYSWKVLPAEVLNQLPGFSTGAAKIPKFIAVLFPFGISVGSAVMSISYRRQAWICLVGYAMNILFWISN